MSDTEKKKTGGEAAAAPETRSSHRESNDDAEITKVEGKTSSALATTPDPREHAQAVAESDLETDHLNRLAKIKDKYTALQSKLTPTAEALIAKVRQLKLMHPAEEEKLQTKARAAEKALNDADKIAQETTALVEEMQASLETAQADLVEKKKALPELRESAAEVRKAFATREKALAANPWVSQLDVADIATQIERMIDKRLAQLESEKTLYLQSLKEDEDAELAAAKDENEASLKALRGA